MGPPQSLKPAGGRAVYGNESAGFAMTARVACGELPAPMDVAGAKLPATRVACACK